MSHRLKFLVLTLAAALASPSMSFGADGDTNSPNKGKITFAGGLDWTSAYFFRGYNQEDGGLILQPYLELNTTLAKSDNLSVNGTVGIWNSVHSQQTFSDDGNSAWYESDIYARVDFGLQGGWTLSGIYTLYTYPNGAFNSIQELGVKALWDDAAFSKEKLRIPFALKPYAAVFFEIDDGNGSDDVYLELGISPTVYSFNLNASTPVSLTVPVVLGLSLDDFYVDSDGDNSFFGYGSIGVAAQMPLPIPSDYGSWSLKASVTYLQLFADSVEIVNNGESNQVIGTVGVSFTY
jgi:hypothetical protein